MGITEEVAARAGIPVVTRGGGEYVHSGYVERFLNEARAQRLGLLGLEGFQLFEDATVPDMNAILDLSDLESDVNFVDCSIDQALSFVRNIAAPDMYFEFVLELRSP
jgi:hypothetical protein